MSSLSDDDDPKGCSLGRVIIEGTNEQTEELVDGGREDGITTKLLAEDEVVEHKWRLGVEGAVIAGEGGSTMVIISMSLWTLLLHWSLLLCSDDELKLRRENLSVVGVLGE